nr:hypothetical protein BaRGS_029820 [Batillaria attramentaria]
MKVTTMKMMTTTMMMMMTMMNNNDDDDDDDVSDDYDDVDDNDENTLFSALDERISLWADWLESVNYGLYSLNKTPLTASQELTRSKSLTVLSVYMG